MSMSSGLDRRSLMKGFALSAALAAPTAAGAQAASAQPASAATAATGKTAMSAGNFVPERLERMRKVMAGHVERGDVPGLVWAVSRGGETHVEAAGTLALNGLAPMRGDSIFRIASLTKPVTATAAMILVEESRLRLDDPVDTWLPELADRKVLKSLDAKLTDTVPANRPVTLRDLLTLRFGVGAIMVYPFAYPVQHAMAEAGIAPSADLFRGSPDAFMKAVGSLPLAHQPGEGWLYHTGLDVAGVLVARAAGQPLSAFMQERIFGPLDMKDTGFHVPAEKVDRLATAYSRDFQTGKLGVYDEAKGGLFAKPASFESGGGGLVSTAEDYLAFQKMLLGKGKLGAERILSRASVELMTTDQLSEEQKASAGMFFNGNSGWGLGMSVALKRDNLFTTPGRFGWDGGYGTSGYADPENDLAGVLLTQRLMDSPQAPKHHVDFWTSAYQAITG
ncbi:CubicO group peptidase (beta-lactamase class C family) [Aminobacter lissarensis]|uniref:CubicO group peptidase (Beta-lactamase class C family) n=1 Tax=Aminobacter carboxidus TaxID=376165 RepID=A0A8E2BD39_9HYPH|nr:serine hydrolase domain-containing protein [Aminobacter lissarensis]MBB6468276.1 CubicO group peptidase (beta-lactamase class C family) [Aminobacter lissarensis]